jgi:HK97 gp10 family phage protein
MGVADVAFSIGIDASDVAALARVEVGGALILASVGEAVDAIETALIDAIHRNMHFDKGYSTGATYDSVAAHRVSLLETEVGPDTFYDMFVEYGTGQRGAASGTNPPSGYSFGPKPGMEAEPYMEPAYREMEPWMEHRIERGVATGLRRIAHG